MDIFNRTKLNQLEQINRTLHDELSSIRYIAADLIDENNKLKSLNIDKDDLKQLRNLCHPDRHNGKRMAIKMTTKLNKLISHIS